MTLWASSRAGYLVGLIQKKSKINLNLIYLFWGDLLSLVPRKIFLLGDLVDGKKIEKKYLN